MKTQLFTLCIMSIFWASNITAQHHLEVEGNVKLDNRLDLSDSSSGESKKVGSIIANHPNGASSNNSPTLTIATETNPIVPNTFADIILESSDKIYFNTNEATRMFVGASGRVGIGTTTPALDLDVNGDAVIGGGSSDHSNAAEYLRIAAESDTWYMGALNESSEAASDFYIGKTGDSNGIFHIENGGDIGIGTDNPFTKLHIDDTGGNPFRISTSSNDNWTSVLTGGGHVGYYGVFNGDTDMDFGTSVLNNTGKVHLVTQASPQLTVEPSGQVGIGTESPTADLHVTGGTGSVRMILESDEDNGGGESQHPRLSFVQDGGLTTADLGYYNSSNNFRIRNNSGTGSQIVIMSNGDIIIGN